MPWIFGYGSLVVRPDFPFVERHFGAVRGYARRFWQGSPDHRGTPEAPGRVVTLVASEAAETWGRVYRVAEAELSSIVAKLDHREKEGYDRLRLTVFDRDGAPITDDALVYVATPGNPSWLGDGPIIDLAAHIARSHGPSGANRDYLVSLHEALAAEGLGDAHVEALVRALPPAVQSSR